MDEYKDDCFCYNCEKHVFVECGSDVCPACGAVGTLGWWDEAWPEVTLSSFGKEA